ncbi:hypothetical protein C5S32_01535 [ANME-1 cluster archaeon GoMg1]|nr:hypothetical protein [ANME-1 cluster archaeon GoMg1]
MKMAFSTKRLEAGLSNNESKIEKRILVISSEIGKLTSVKTVPWSEELPNIADFDVVIMDLVSLYFDVENNKIKLNNLRYPNKEAVSKLIEFDGELIVISYPATHLTQPVPERISGQPMPPMQPHGISSCISNSELLTMPTPRSPHNDLYWWSPIPIKNILEDGSSIPEIKDTPFHEYIEQGIKKWSYYLELRKPQEKFTPDYGDANCDYWREYNIEPIALNRYALIAASFSITVKAKPRYASGESDVHVISTSGPVVILPPPTEFTIEEAIRLILAKLYGVALESVEPEWLQNYKVPGENELEKEIRSLEQKIEEDKREVEQKKKQMKDLTKFKKLLTETGGTKTGEGVLEEIVWETLEELGATVKRPDEPGKSDGWFTDYKGRKAVLEIKGKRGRKSIATGDVRELENWVSDGLAKREEYKGIFFGNPFREDCPEERKEPFPPDVRGFAEKRHQCIVATVQLFEAFTRVKAGKMKPEEIFDKLMETNGVCELITD